MSKTTSTRIIRDSIPVLLGWCGLSLAVGMGTLSAAAQSATGALRTQTNFNHGWRFSLGDHEHAERQQFDDSSWDQVGLPHSFSIPYFLSPDFYVGHGWYRKHFTVPASAAAKRVFIEFEAVFQVAEVFVNGEKIGEHRGGYTGFSVDITRAVKAGKDNHIAVRVNNLWDARLAPRAGEHVFSGGIYRDVWLVVTDPVHVCWNGTFVQTPGVNRESATVRIETEVANLSDAEEDVSVQTDILAPDGKSLASVKSPAQKLAAGSRLTFSQLSPAIAHPQLWSPETPLLHTAVTTVLCDGKAVDSFTTSFGIRWFEWTADKGFFLNGKHLYLRGANVHQDQAGWGDAVTNAAIYRDVKMMKEAGFNFIRGSHYPHDPAFSRACDELGMLLWSESAFWGVGGHEADGYWNSSAYPPAAEDQPAFEASAREQLAEMVRIHRNHPSIIAWSMCNEAFFTESSAMPQMSRLLETMVADSRRLDPTRPAAIGGAQRPLGRQRIDRIGDLAGYNGDGATIAEFQDPGLPSIVSEYGSTTADRPGKYEPGWGDLAKAQGQSVYPWRSGQAIWCGFDHGSIAGGRFGKMGIVDYFRLPKRSWYWYRNEYSSVPPPQWPEKGTPARLLLTADRTDDILADGTDDVLLIAQVADAQGKPISNSPPVDLKVASGPGEFPTGPSIRFEEKSDIRILDGTAAIAFRSYCAGETIIRATSPGLEPAELAVRFTGLVKYIAGVTPPTRERPYQRFVRDKNHVVAREFGRNNPAFASSAAEGRSAGHATDGDPHSYWQPQAGDTHPSLVLDMEKFVAVSQVRLVFPREDVFRYRIEISDDRENWHELLDRTSNTRRERQFVGNLSNRTVGRFVRVSFPSARTPENSGLSDIRVVGVIEK